MSTPIYHEQIVALRRYSLELNWFQAFFFPDEVMSHLESYTSETAVSQAFDVYSALSQGNPFLNWIRQLFLPGLKHFVEDTFTQAVLNLETLTLDTFTQQANLEDAPVSPPAPTEAPPVQQIPTINLPSPALTGDLLEHQQIPSAAAALVSGSPSSTRSADDLPDPHHSPVHHEQVANTPAEIVAAVASAATAPITIHSSSNSPQSFRPVQLTRVLESELNADAGGSATPVQRQPVPAVHCSPLAPAATDPTIIVTSKETVRTCCC
jgi:hypothetical protein